MTVVLLAAAVVLFVVAGPAHLPLVATVTRVRVERRRRRSRAGLPTLVDALASALASGLSLPQAFAEIAPTAPSDLATATRQVAASLFLGIAVTDAMACYAAVVPERDIAPITVVLVSFHRTGGRVAAALGRVAALLRGRLALESERAALTAQARASAFVLVSLAPLGAGFFAVAMPDYGSALLGDGLGLAILALVFESLGGIWLWWIVRTSAARLDLALFLDALVVGLEAGLTFERALAGLVERTDDLARIRDVRRLVADLRLGVPIGQALRQFAHDPDEARVAALIATATRFGAPLAHLLVTQADALRTTERHRAETAARRLPILMLFPLALCILPALLIVFLGPPLLSLLR